MLPKVFSKLKLILFALLAMFGLGVQASLAADYSDVIAKVKPSVVALGNYQPLRQPAIRFIGTGFVVADGRHIITNAHNIPEFLDPDKKESLVVIVPGEDRKKIRIATVIKKDKQHDVALLRFSDSALTALPLGNGSTVKEGQEYLMSGFPIGSALGYHVVTHKTMVSAITPAVQPVNNSKQLKPRLIKRMLAGFDVFQLDAIAYPGNSGSPVYHTETGEVIGVLNSVFVKDTKESILERPSGISYAIPVSYAQDLLRQAGLISKR